MNYPIALVVSVTIVCATALTIESATSQSSAAVGTYRVTQAGIDRIFVVETTTGRVASCAGSQKPTCSSFSAPPER